MPRTVPLTVVTSSSLKTLRSCPKQYWFAYEMRLRRVQSRTALRLGSAYHRGLELLGMGAPLQDVVDAVRDNYAHVPVWANAHSWAVERETVCAMVVGHHWRYGNDTLRVLATERVPLETLLCHAPNAGTGVLVDLHVLVDAQGNLARQIDHEGLRYRFSGSNATWVLVVSAPTIFFSNQPLPLYAWVPSAEGMRRSWYATYELIGIVWYKLRHAGG